MTEETHIALGVGVGLRLSEVLGASIEDLDVEACTYRPVTQYRPFRRVDGKSIGTHDGPLKTETSGTEILVDPWVVDWLVSLLRGRRTGRLVTFEASRSGGRMSQKALRNRVYAAVSELGGEPAKLVPLGPDGKMRQQMGFHSLRHLYGSLLADGAYILADVTRRVRHKNNTTTLDIYTHVVDGQRDSAQTIGQALRNRLRDYRKTTTGMRIVGET
ncbi:tyrosine-type recombinase/integrase [Nocardia carnea]|uniref:tyrosine-type recombinase/integrase n=1 Tax=Nocardia carnea TaxID=37328 RepID=UPI0024578F05|nr:tyrosine-type recombinase/integrase [Nocardia carnea]